MRMHPAPSLAESFPKDSKQEERPAQHASPGEQQYQQPPQQSQQADHQPQAQPQQHQSGHGTPNPLLDQPTTSTQPSSPMRKDTGSSNSTNATDATAVTNASAETGATSYSVESSQSIFSVKDGAEVSSNRRASRRRTGPLSAQQREKAALIRKLGACADCRRRRVAVSLIMFCCPPPLPSISVRCGRLTHTNLRIVSPKSS